MHDWDVEELFNLITDHVPELIDGWIYEAKEEDYLPPGVRVGDMCVALALEDVFDMRLKPKMRRLQEVGIDLDVSTYAPWG